jgi:hypothetical protein
VKSLTPGAPTLDEPGGLSIADGKIYIPDTNNHRVRILDLATQELVDFSLRDPKKLLSGSE